MAGHYRIITLCGDSLFEKQSLKEQKRLTLEGYIVLNAGQFDLLGETADWEMLEDMQRRKVEMADAVYVINVGGYIDDCTKSLIEYARSKGKEVLYYDENEYTLDEVYWGLGGSTGSLPSHITPSKVKALRKGQIFVFGSNCHGSHGAGAARVAVEKFGAIWGQGEGLQGSSYALPTMEGIENLEKAVKRFTEFAGEHQKLEFLVTAVGCGIAGYAPEEVAPFFSDAAFLRNVYLPLSFWEVIVKMGRKR